MLNEEIMQLIGKEISLDRLQRQLKGLGFLVEEEKEIISSILEDERVIYTHKICDDWKISVIFEITDLASEEEHINITYIKIIDIF